MYRAFCAESNVLNKIKTAGQVVYINHSSGRIAEHMHKSYAEMVSPTGDNGDMPLAGKSACDNHLLKVSSKNEEKSSPAKSHAALEW